MHCSRVCVCVYVCCLYFPLLTLRKGSIGVEVRKEGENLHCNRLNIRSFHSPSFSELNFNLSTSPPRRLKLFSFIISAFNTLDDDVGMREGKEWDLRMMSILCLFLVQF